LFNPFNEYPTDYVFPTFVSYDDAEPSRTTVVIPVAARLDLRNVGWNFDLSCCCCSDPAKAKSY